VHIWFLFFSGFSVLLFLLICSGGFSWFVFFLHYLKIGLFWWDMGGVERGERKRGREEERLVNVPLELIISGES
jgi:hypothetical protein